MIIEIWYNTSLRQARLRFCGSIVRRKNRPTKSATRYWKRLKCVLRRPVAPSIPIRQGATRNKARPHGRLGCGTITAVDRAPVISVA